MFRGSTCAAPRKGRRLGAALDAPWRALEERPQFGALFYAPAGFLSSCLERGIKMALIRCPECDRQISDKARACPGCGCPVDVSLAMPNPRDSKTVANAQQPTPARPSTEDSPSILVAIWNFFEKKPRTFIVLLFIPLILLASIWERWSDSSKEQVKPVQPSATSSTTVATPTTAGRRFGYHHRLPVVGAMADRQASCRRIRARSIKDATPLVNRLTPSSVAVHTSAAIIQRLLRIRDISAIRGSTLEFGRRFALSKQTPPGNHTLILKRQPRLSGQQRHNDRLKEPHRVTQQLILQRLHKCPLVLLLGQHHIQSRQSLYPPPGCTSRPSIRIP